MLDTRFSQNCRRREFVRWIGELEMTHALTLNTDRVLSAKNLSAIFSLFCKKLDVMAHGRNLRGVPTEDRLLAIGFPENLRTNAHLHVAADLTFLQAPARTRPAGLYGLIHDAWLQSTNNTGSIYVGLHPDRGWFEYMTKHFTRTGGQFFLSVDYHPH